jgi:hypothetical protein
MLTAPPLRYHPHARSLALLLLMSAGCATKDQPRRDTAAVRSDTTRAAAILPLWYFGETTSRRDSLPRELDSLRSSLEYGKRELPVAYRVDLNLDGKPEWLVRSNTSICGRQGCPTYLFTRDSTGKFVDVLDGLLKDVYVTNQRVHGWPIIWVDVGGRDGGIFQMEFDGMTYRPTTTLRGPRVPTEEAPPPDTLAALLARARAP